MTHDSIHCDKQYGCVEFSKQVNRPDNCKVCKESPLKKRLNHIQGLKKVIKTKVCKERLLKKHLEHIHHGLKKVVKTKVSKNLKVNNALKIMSSKYSNNFKSHNKKRIILKNNATKSAEVDSNIYENKEFSNQNNKKKMAANEDIDTKNNVICLQSMQCDVSKQKHSLKASSYSRAEFGEPSKHSKKVHKANVIFSENSKSHNSSYIAENQLTNNFQHSICLNRDYLNGAVRREEIPLSGEEEEEEISVCSICQKEFNSLYGLRLHNKIVHTVAIALECTVCKEVFQTNKLLSNHISRCHNMRNALLSKNDFLCPKCGLVVKSRASLHRHNKRFHVDIPAKIMCDICGKVFKFTSHLTSHKNFMHPTESDKVTCHICSKEFVCQVRLKKHMRTTHCETRKYICEHCQRAFKDKKTLDVHRVTHCNESPFKCDICEKTFRTKYKLNTHLTSHSVEQFKCTICYRLFVSDANLRIHIEKSHNNDTQGFHCEICDKDISTKSQYDLHLQFHSDPDMQMFECDLCGKCFESKVKCQRHRLYHDIDNKERQCSVCNKTFKNNKILKHHMFLHSSNAFLYKCSICDKTFRHSSAFSSHQRVHSDKYYYECNLCNEKFKWKQTYDKHVQKCVIKLDIGKSEDQDSKTDGCKGMPESLQPAAFTWCFDPS